MTFSASALLEDLSNDEDGVSFFEKNPDDQDTVQTDLNSLSSFLPPLQAVSLPSLQAVSMENFVPFSQTQLQPPIPSFSPLVKIPLAPPVSLSPLAPVSLSPLAKLVWLTPNAEELIAFIARVSSPQQELGRPFAGLLKYLIKNEHWSPLEMACMCIEINTTRDISAQMIRHRSFSFQEFSQRYAKISEFPPIPHFRRQDTKNRQASIDDFPEDLQIQFHSRTRDYFIEGQLLYEDLLAAGVAKECARKVLPMNSPTKVYMTGTIRSWIHYLAIRNLKKGAQLEHALIGEEIKKIFARELPTIFAAALVE